MRIFHILNHTHLYNGHVNVAVDLACIQAQMGHSVTVISGPGDFDELFEKYGVARIRIEQTRNPFVVLRALVALGRLIRRMRPDIIHAHMMTAAVLAFALRPIGGFRLVTTVHNEFEKSAVLMGLGDRVVGVSRAVAESMARRGVRSSKLRVVLNGTIGSPRLDSTPPRREALAHPAILFVGGLHPRKGVEDLVRAFHTVAGRLDRPHLYLVGAGPHEDSYRQLAADLGLERRVTFCGSQRDPRPFFLGADIFVLPSHAEPGGLVLVEAREAGCAIVATNVDGIPEMLDGGEAGLLVPPRDPAALARTLLQILEDESLRDELRGRAMAGLSRFTVERVAREYLGHYEELLSGAPAPSKGNLRMVHLP